MSSSRPRKRRTRSCATPPAGWRGAYGGSVASRPPASSTRASARTSASTPERLQIALGAGVDDAGLGEAPSRLHARVVPRHVLVRAVRPPSGEAVQAEAREGGGRERVGER